MTTAQISLDWSPVLLPAGWSLTDPVRLGVGGDSAGVALQSDGGGAGIGLLEGVACTVLALPEGYAWPESGLCPYVSIGLVLAYAASAAVPTGQLLGCDPGTGGWTEISAPAGCTPATPGYCYWDTVGQFYQQVFEGDDGPLLGQKTADGDWQLYPPPTDYSGLLAYGDRPGNPLRFHEGVHVTASTATTAGAPFSFKEGDYAAWKVPASAPWRDAGLSAAAATLGGSSNLYARLVGSDGQTCLYKHVSGGFSRMALPSGMSPPLGGWLLAGPNCLIALLEDGAGSPSLWRWSGGSWSALALPAGASLDPDLYGYADGNGLYWPVVSAGVQLMYAGLA